MRQPDPMAVDKMSPATPRDAKKVTMVDYVVVSCAEKSIRFYTDQGIFPYPLVYKGVIPDGVFTASVTVEGNTVNFDFGDQAEEEGTFDFGWKIEKGKENPATFFKSQSKVMFILRGDKTGTQIPKDIASAKVSKHIDNAKTIKYDSTYKAKGYGGLSPWLQITYKDGTKIDVHMDQIEDGMLAGGDVLTAHKQSFIGKGGRITPIRINRQTAPNLFAAKFRAIEEQTAATNTLILTSVPAILFIISLGAHPSIVGPTPKGGGANAGKSPAATQGAKQGAKSLAEMTAKQMGNFVRRVFRANPILRRLAAAQKLKGQALHRELINILSLFESQTGVTVQRVAQGVVQKARGPNNLASLRSHPGLLQIEQQVFKDTAKLNAEIIHELAFYYAKLGNNGVIPKLTNGALNAMNYLQMMIQSGGKLPSLLK